MAFFVSAIAAAVAAPTLATIAAAVADTGIALSVTGAVTGNATLSKVGGVMSLAGGVGALANGLIGAAGTGIASGLSGAADGTVTSDADLAAGLNPDVNPVNTAQYAGQGDGADGTAASATNARVGAVDAGAGVPAPIADGSVPSVPAVDATLGGNVQAPAGTLAPSGVSSGATGGVAGGGLGTAQTNTPLSAATAQAGTSLPNNAASNATAAAGVNAPGAIAPPTNTSPDGIAQWYASQAPQVKAALIQGGAGLVGGLFNGWTQLQKLALQQQQQNLAQTQYANAMTNASAQPAIAAFKPPAQVVGTGLLQSNIGSSNV